MFNNYKCMGFYILRWQASRIFLNSGFVEILRPPKEQEKLFVRLSFWKPVVSNQMKK